MRINYKRHVPIKGRVCADDRPQKLWMQKEYTTSPTVSIQCLLFSFIIDAKEDRYVATADIPGYVLQTYDTRGITHLKFYGMMSELMAQIYPYLYRKYINTHDTFCKLMYSEFLKYLYETLDKALIFWVKLSTFLERWGFRMN